MQKTTLTRRAFFVASCLLSLATFASVGYAQDETKVQAITDIVYKKVGDREIKLNLYLPVKDGKTIKGEPLLIWLDSGCWYSGDPGDGFVWKALGADERGFAVASVSHRPISESAFPAPMEDVRAAVRFLRKHAEEYGYDPERFAVSGASSGGHLSLTLGISDEKSPFNVGDDLDVSGQVQRVIDFYGPTDLGIVFERYPQQALDCIYLAVGMERSASDKNNAAAYSELLERAKKFSPITYVDSNFAPTLILQGTVDPVVPASQSALFFEELRVAGVRSQIMYSDGGVHDLGSLFPRELMAREIFEFLRW